MSVSAGTVWECRADANDNQPGGFDSSFGGTDYSQQAAAQVSFTDLLIKSLNGPVAPVAVAVSGGSLAAGTYYIAFSYGNGSQETALSPQTAVVLSGTQQIQFTAPVNPNIAGIDRYQIYLSQTSGSNFRRQNVLANWGVAGNNQNAYNSGATLFPGGTLGNVLSSAAHNAVSAEVGNTIKINSGTGFTTTVGSNVYQIVALQGTDYIVDRIAGTVGSSSGNGKLGGAAATPTNYFLHAQPGNVGWGRGAAGIANIANSNNVFTSSLLYTPQAGTMVLRIRFYGYTTVRGDGGKYTLKVTFAATAFKFLQSASDYWTFRNLVLDANSQTNYCFYNTSNNCIFANSDCTNALVNHVFLSGLNTRAWKVTASGGNGVSPYDFQSGYGCFWSTAASSTFEKCTAHDAQNNGFVSQNAAPLFIDCNAYNLGTGGQGNGFGAFGPYAPRMVNCVSYNNSKAGLFLGRNVAATEGDVFLIRGCVFAKNGTYGIDSINDRSATPGWGEDAFQDNAFWGNTTAARHFTPAVTSDITLTGDPFTSGGTGDFTLGTVAGAALKASTGNPLRYQDGGGLTLAPSSDPPIQSFDEVQFPTDISRGAVGGPSYRTTVTITGSGSEQRVAQWNDPLYKWNVAHGLKSVAAAQTLLAFFVARQGRARAFRFKDWNDYNVTSEAVVAITGTTFQIVKRYTSGAVTKIRNIKKPVAGTLSLVDNVGATVSGALYSVDTTTGIITYTGSPAYTPIATCQFDVPVRFDTDEMQLTQTDVTYRDWDSIPVIEVR